MLFSSIRKTEGGFPFCLFHELVMLEGGLALLVAAGSQGSSGAGTLEQVLQHRSSLCSAPIPVLVQKAALSEGSGTLCFPALHCLLRAVGATCCLLSEPLWEVCGLLSHNTPQAASPAATRSLGACSPRGF